MYMKFDHFKKHIIPFLDKIWYYHGVDRPSIPARPLVIEWAGFSRWGDDHFFQRHVSDIFVVEQVTMGNARFIQGGKEYIVGPGDIFLLRQGPDHWYGVGPCGFLHKRLARISGPLLDSLLRTIGLWEQNVIRPPSPGEITLLLRKAANLLRKKEPGWIDASSILAYEILVRLSKIITPEPPYAMTKALAYIERNLQKPLTNKDICSQTGFSLTHFNRLFRQHAGMAPMSYLISQRVTWAKRLLTNTSLSIKQVAATIGYENQLYFSALFKKHAGISPKEYRAVARNKNEAPQSGANGPEPEH
jgi:AraC-like DNA-binding protein